MVNNKNIQQQRIKESDSLIILFIIDPIDVSIDTQKETWCLKDQSFINSLGTDQYVRGTESPKPQQCKIKSSCVSIVIAPKAE